MSAWTQLRHPERSEGPCPAELDPRVRRSLAALGMTGTGRLEMTSTGPASR